MKSLQAIGPKAECAVSSANRYAFHVVNRRGVATEVDASSVLERQHQSAGPGEIGLDVCGLHRLYQSDVAPVEAIALPIEANKNFGELANADGPTPTKWTLWSCRGLASQW